MFTTEYKHNHPVFFIFVASEKSFLPTKAKAKVNKPARKNLMPANNVFAPVSPSAISNALNPSFIKGKANAR